MVDMDEDNLLDVVLPTLDLNELDKDTMEVEYVNSSTGSRK